MRIRHYETSSKGEIIMSHPMTPIITTFERPPDGGKGLTRDMRVRWALEEVGQPYEVRLVSFGAMKEPAHRALHPFGQIPTYEEGDLALFESGAIVFHIAERHAGLLPDDANARAPGRCRLARWCLQRGRSDDGDGAAQVEAIGNARRISETRRLCRPRHSAACLQACFRRSIGGVQCHATEWLRTTDV